MSTFERGAGRVRAGRVQAGRAEDAMALGHDHPDSTKGAEQPWHAGHHGSAARKLPDRPVPGCVRSMWIRTAAAAQPMAMAMRSTRTGNTAHTEGAQR